MIGVIVYELIAFILFPILRFSISQQALGLASRVAQYCRLRDMGETRFCCLCSRYKIGVAMTFTDLFENDDMKLINLLPQDGAVYYYGKLLETAIADMYLAKCRTN